VIDPDVFSFAALWRHYRRCRRNKRNTANALTFEVDAEANLLALQAELRGRSYRPGRSVCFVTDGPKPREVFAAEFRDRVVHHLLVAHQERVFEPLFIYDSYACRKAKGTLAASERLTTFLRRVTANGTRPAWALKLDVASFFPSIHKETLYTIIARHVADPRLLWLTRTLLFHDPTSDYRFRSRDGRTPPPTSARYPVPRQKSLFGKYNERGLPIGNLTSQFWGNVYLNELDHYVKRELRCRYYLRYVDDIVLLDEDRETLDAWHAKIERFLDERLCLALRADIQAPQPVAKGIEFVGWRTWRNRRVPRRRTLANVHGRLQAFERTQVRPTYGASGRCINLGDGRNSQAVERLQTSLASYTGHLRHGATWRAWSSLWGAHPWLAGLFTREGWKLEMRWRARRTARFTSLQGQYASLLQHAKDDSLLFLQVGRFIEFYGPQRRLASEVLGLRRSKLRRASYAFTAGFPTHLGAEYLRRALGQGYMVVWVVQKYRGLPDRGWVRCPTRIHLPVEAGADTLVKRCC
jgi:retron-type reverse transcriptase